MTILSFIFFLGQVTMQVLASNGHIELTNTTIQHEDLISSLSFLTFMIIAAIEGKTNG